jgi:hypothetical protein
VSHRLLPWLESGLELLGHWLLRADIGMGLLVLVGLSMALSQVFALLANRLNARQILVRVLLDSLVLCLAFLLIISLDMLLLWLFASRPIHPDVFINSMAVCCLPGLFYVLAAAPYISDLIAITIWVLIHLNLISLTHLRFALPYGEALVLLTPGYGLAMLLVWLQFRQSWRLGYSKLASQLPGTEGVGP